MSGSIVSVLIICSLSTLRSTPAVCQDQSFKIFSGGAAGGNGFQAEIGPSEYRELFIAGANCYRSAKASLHRCGAPEYSGDRAALCGNGSVALLCSTHYRISSNTSGVKGFLPACRLESSVCVLRFFSISAPPIPHDCCSAQSTYA